MAYEVADDPEITWWLVGLTDQRLLGTSLESSPRVWSHQRGAWATSLAGTDVVLSLGVGRHRVFDLIREGAIRSVKVGSSRRVSARALCDYVAQLELGDSA